jgi:hypothetical protein
MEIMMDENELVDIDLDTLEEAYHKQELQSIPLDQLQKVHKVYINSTVGTTSRSGGVLGIHQDPRQDVLKINKGRQATRKKNSSTTHSLGR